MTHIVSSASSVLPPSPEIILKQIPDIITTGVRMPFFFLNPKNIDSASSVRILFPKVKEKSSHQSAPCSWAEKSTSSAAGTMAHGVPFTPSITLACALLGHL